MDPITCERCYMVSGGGVPSAKPWLIRDSQVEQEGNMVFLKLERKDTALGRLITGHSRSNPLRDYNFFDILKRERNVKQVRTKGTLQTADGDVKKLALMRAWKRQRLVANDSPSVAVDLPRVAHAGEAIGPITMHVKRVEGKQSKNVSVELTAENLTYIRIACLVGGKKAGRVRRWKTKPGTLPDCRDAADEPDDASASDESSEEDSAGSVLLQQEPVEGSPAALLQQAEEEDEPTGTQHAEENSPVRLPSGTQPVQGRSPEHVLQHGDLLHAGDMTPSAKRPRAPAATPPAIQNPLLRFGFKSM